MLTNSLYILQELSEELKGSKGKFHYLKTDLLKEDQIVSAFEKINTNFGGVDFLINNAGIGIPTLAQGVYTIVRTSINITECIVTYVTLFLVLTE